MFYVCDQAKYHSQLQYGTPFPLTLVPMNLYLDLKVYCALLLSRIATQLGLLTVAYCYVLTWIKKFKVKSKVAKNGKIWKSRVKLYSYASKVYVFLEFS